MEPPARVLVTFEQTPISFDYLRNACQVGLNFVEVVDPTQAPTLRDQRPPACGFLRARFPRRCSRKSSRSSRSSTSACAKSGGARHLSLRSPRHRWAAQLYLPRLIGIGEPGSDVLISQDIKGSSDNVRFTFGNADRVMTQLANDTDLKYAEIDLCLFHVNSGILLQLWKGVIQNFTSDGTPISRSRAPTASSRS